jgi:hypothetical protein
MNDEFSVPSDSQIGGEVVPASAYTRQEERLAGVPEIYKTKHERLACELALRMEEPAVVFQAYGYDVDAAAALMESPSFTALLDRIGTEVRENGLAFKSKMKAVAEDLIPHAYDMATDPLCSSAVRADIIKWSAKMAGFEPAPQKSGELPGAGGFSLSITFAGQAPQAVITEGRTLEHQP